MPLERYKDYEIDMDLKEVEGKWIAIPKITAPDGTDTGPYGYRGPFQRAFLTPSEAKQEVLSYAHEEIDKLIKGSA